MAAVTALGAFFATQGGLGVLWEQDQTKLSFLLLLIFTHMSAWCGYKTWRLSKFLDRDETEKYLVEKKFVIILEIKIFHSLEVNRVLD